MALSGLEKTFDEYLVRKAPFQLPANVKEWIVKFSPWITLVLLILLLPALLLVIGLGAVVGGVAPAVGVAVGPFYWLAFVVLIAQVVVMAMSIPGLMKRQLSGWNLVYYSELVAVVYVVLTWLGHPLAIFGLIAGLISPLIGLYILFQIRSYYH